MRGPGRSPAQRVRLGEDEHRNERIFARRAETSDMKEARTKWQFSLRV